MHAWHQASEAAYEAKITRYIDLAIVEEVQANDYREGFEKVRDELKLERQEGGERPGNHCFKRKVKACVSSGAEYLGKGAGNSSKED
ncbi:hypothetical protein ACFX2F_025760 [Malus domestica]